MKEHGMSEDKPVPPWGNTDWKPVRNGWQPGQSGNPRGPKVGTKRKITLICEALDNNVEAVVQATIAKALTGDVGACKLILERVKPPMRNEGPRVQFAFDPHAPLAQQGRQVFRAMTQGEVDVDTGKMMLDMLNSFAKLVETDELAKRLEALEAQALAAATAGHVLGRVMQQTAGAA